MLRALSRLLLAAGLVLAASPPIARAEPAAAVASVKVEAALVHATRDGAFVDPALQAFAADLRALPYTRFEKVETGAWPVASGGRAEGRLRDVRIVVTVTAVDAAGATMQVELWRADKRLGTTTVTRPFGRAHVLAAGSDSAGALLVPVRVVR